MLMKKFTAYVLILTMFSLTSITVAQDDSDGYKWDPFMPIKGAFGDVSVGSDGFGFGVGARYAFVGLNLALTGIANSSPSYQLYNPNIPLKRTDPLPVGYTQERFMSMMINVDAMFYLDLFESLGFNASIGYYSKNDTILAKDMNGSRLFWKNETDAGLCFGVGAEYLLQESFSVGAGFHTQRGAVIRLTYLWF